VTLRNASRLLAGALLICPLAPASAAEGPSIAGPIGGTDVRSATLPPPGLYAGAIALWADAFRFVDGQGNLIPALSDARLDRVTGGPFVVYVPDVQVLGGSVGLAGFQPMGRLCGRLFATAPKICQTGLGDPYIEAAWSRSFGTLRPSRHPGAFPILEGLSIKLAFGVVVPIGQYNATSAITKALSSGTNIWDFAPSIAVTYTTPAILAEGTEFSFKTYWNNYLTNPATGYSTGTIINTDFAITERIGRFQIGVAGYYLHQIADDKINGVPVAPDGIRAKILSLGGVLVYDMPEHGTSIKVKALQTVRATSNVYTHAVVVGFFKKLR